jgi:flagellar basal body-associated protein FliL
MADEKKDAKAPAKEPEKADAHGAKAKGGGMGAMFTKLPILLGGVMIIEAVVLFAGFKFLGGGKPTVVVGADLVKEEGAGASEHGEAKEEGKGEGKSEEKGGHGGGEAAAPSKDKNASVEVVVVEMKAPNKVSGKTFLYDVSIWASTKGANEEKVKSTFKAREALIKDRIRTIIAQSDPEKLGGGSEPGLETLRRQVKHQLDEIVGDKIIDEVLVPRCIPFRTDY